MLSKYDNNKSFSPFFIFFNGKKVERDTVDGKKVEKDSVDFWHRKMTLKVRILLFLTFNSKTTEWPKIFFMAIFIVLWPYLLTTKLRCLQKNNFGHTKYTYQASYKEEAWVLLVYLCNEQIFCQAVSKVHTKFILEVLRDQPIKFNHSLSNWDCYAC